MKHFRNELCLYRLRGSPSLLQRPPALELTASPSLQTGSGRPIHLLITDLPLVGIRWDSTCSVTPKHTYTNHKHYTLDCVTLYTTNSISLQTKIGHVTYHRLPTAPSIPIPSQNYGYDEDMEGVLRPQKLPTKDSTIGPAYYNVMHVCGISFHSILNTYMHAYIVK